MSKGDRRLNSYDRNLYRVLAAIAVPISIQGIVSATLNLVDSLMVGVLGEEQLAAIGIATQVFAIHYMLLFGFTGGTATFSAQFFGKGDMKSIRRTTGFAAAVMLLTSVVFFVPSFFFTEKLLRIYSDDPALIAMAVPYVRIVAPTFFFIAVSSPLEMAFKATQQPKVPMIVSMAVFTANTFLNYILIFGKFGAPALGIAGAGIATTLARALEIIINLTFAVKKSNSFRGAFRDYLQWNRNVVKRIVKNSTATTANEVLWGAGQSMYVAAFSRLGTTALAAFQAAHTIYNIFSFAAFSIGDAALILVGKKIGEGKGEETWKLAQKLFKIGAAFGTAVGLIQIASAYPFVNLFSLTLPGRICALKILAVEGAFMGLNLYNGIGITGVLRSGGDTRFAMIAECSCVWFISVPIAFVTSLVFHLPVYCCILAMKVQEVVEAAVLRKRFCSGKWMNLVIGQMKK